MPVLGSLRINSVSYVLYTDIVSMNMVRMDD